MSPIRAAIIAGGRGTRMGPLGFQPKAVLPVGGVPIVHRHIDALAAAGIADITICAGHMADALQATLSNRRIRLYVEERPLGSGGCLGAAFPDCGDDLVVVFGDVMMNLDVAPLVAFHRSHRPAATLVVHPNDHPHDSDLVEIDGDGWITAIHRKPHAANLPNQVIAGVFVLSAELVRSIDGTAPRDLVHDILFPAHARGARLAGYVTGEYLKDIGTPQRYEQVCAEWTYTRASPSS